MICFDVVVCFFCPSRHTESHLYLYAMSSHVQNYRYPCFEDSRGIVSICPCIFSPMMFDSGMPDGYYVAKTERIDDILLAEERLESIETSTDSVNAVPEVEDSIDAIVFGTFL